MKELLLSSVSIMDAGYFELVKQLPIAYSCISSHLRNQQYDAASRYMKGARNFE
jgi:hypothetical protein